MSVSTPAPVAVPRDLAEWVSSLLKRRLVLGEQMEMKYVVFPDDIDLRDRRWVKELDAVLGEATS